MAHIRARGQGGARAIGRYLWELHPKVARNFPRSVFDRPSKRCNCNDRTSKHEKLIGKLRATLWGNYAMGPHPQSKQLAPQETLHATASSNAPVREHYTR